LHLSGRSCPSCFPRDVFKYIIEKFGLADKENNGTVTIAITIDGAKLEVKVCHINIGFKILDMDAAGLNTGKKVMLNMQSYQWCFPLTTRIAKDKKTKYNKYFDHIFDFCNEIRVDGLMLDDGTKWQPFLVLESQDMNSHQLGLCVGGVAQVPSIIHVCNCCSITSDNIALPNQI
jgi:hypothetical protein